MEGSISGEEFVAMFFDEPPDVAQFSGAETVAARERNGVEPELRLEIVTRDMDVRRFVILAAVKMKAIRPDAQNRGHGAMLPAHDAVSNST
jgi:hypothetical protein